MANLKIDVAQIAANKDDISQLKQDLIDFSQKLADYRLADGRWNGEEIELTLGNGTTYTITIQPATDSQDGLMTAGDHQILTDVAARVDSLEEGGVWRATYATAADLPTTIPANWTINDYVYVTADENHGGVETSYIVVAGGALAFRKVEATPIATATNSSLGVVQGGANVNVSATGQLSVDLSGYAVKAGNNNFSGASNIFTNPPTVPTPVGQTDAANKVYVDQMMPKAGGTFTGQVVGQNGSIATKQFRNVTAQTTDLTAGTSTLNQGDIVLVYMT